MISHDGTKVAYTVAEGGRLSGYVIPVAGGTARKVCDGCDMQGWLADNRRILTIVGLPGRVQVLDVADGTAHDALIDPKSGIGRVDVSPDSRWLAFGGGGRRRVLIAPLRPRKTPGESEWVSLLTTRAAPARSAMRIDAVRHGNCEPRVRVQSVPVDGKHLAAGSRT